MKTSNSTFFTSFACKSKLARAHSDSFCQHGSHLSFLHTLDIDSCPPLDQKQCLLKSLRWLKISPFIKQSWVSPHLESDPLHSGQFVMIKQYGLLYSMSLFLTEDELSLLILCPVSVKRQYYYPESYQPLPLGSLFSQS